MSAHLHIRQPRHPRPAVGGDMPAALRRAQAATRAAARMADAAGDPRARRLRAMAGTLDTLATAPGAL